MSFSQIISVCIKCNSGSIVVTYSHSLGLFFHVFYKCKEDMDPLA